MKTYIFWIWAIIFSSPALFAQSPYELKTGRELGLFGAGIGLTGTAWYFHKKLDPLTVAQIGALNQQGISSFEHWSTTQFSTKSGTASDVLLYTSQALPVVLTLLDKPARKDAFAIATMYSQTALINGGLTGIFKNTVRRTRPFVYHDNVPLEEKMSRSARTSFYSGHASQTASMCFLTARLYADYHPESKWKPVVWAAAATIPAATGILRMTAGKHFPTDVLTGYLTGAAIGYLIPYIHRRK